MRLMVGRPETGGAARVYRLEAEGMTDLTAADPRIGPDLSGLAADPALLAAAAAIPASPAAGGVVPALPIERPGKTLCIGLNYAEHAKEGGHEIPDYPAIFMRGRTSLIPAEAAMVVPAASPTLDYEAELMIVVGTGGRDIAEADAAAHIFGYTCFNDGSVRAYQHKGAQWTPGKNFDATGAVGPVVVTPDELPANALGLRIQCRVNGAALQDSTTSDMIFTPARVIAILSEVMTLEPGDLIALGTPQGVGVARSPQVFLTAGDTVEVDIEGVGVLRSPIAAAG